MLDINYDQDGIDSEKVGELFFDNDPSHLYLQSMKLNKIKVSKFTKVKETKDSVFQMLTQ